MSTGTVIIIIGDDVQKNQIACDGIQSMLHGVILNKKIIEQLQGDENFKRKILVQNLKTAMASSFPCIVWDYDAGHIKNRKDITSLVLQANYRLVALVVDTPKDQYTMGTDAVDYDEGFTDILFIH